MYEAKGTFNDMLLPVADKMLIAHYKQQWNIADKKKDAKAKEKWHQKADEIRSKWNYTGGVDGSDFIQITRNTTTPTTRTPRNTVKSNPAPATASKSKSIAIKPKAPEPQVIYVPNTTPVAPKESIGLIALLAIGVLLIFR